MQHALITVKEYGQGLLHYVCVLRALTGRSNRLRPWQHHCEGITSMAKNPEKSLTFFFFFYFKLPRPLCGRKAGRGRKKYNHFFFLDSNNCAKDF